MSEISVSAGQALNGLQAAFTNDSIRQEGRMALQLIESASATQPGNQVANQSTPSERIGQNINIKA